MTFKELIIDLAEKIREHPEYADQQAFVGIRLYNKREKQPVINLATIVELAHSGDGTQILMVDAFDPVYHLETI